MKLSEVFDTKIKLDWTHDVNEFYTEFSIKENRYGVSAIEETIDGVKTLRIDFHFKKGNEISHDLTNFGNDSLKVLGIISNGVKEKFSNFNIIYFLAKRTESDNEFDSRVKLYSRIVDKLKVESNRIAVKKEMKNEYLFALCKTTEDKDVLIKFID